VNDVAAASYEFLREENLVDWLRQFVRFPSEQTDLHERDPQVQAFIRKCAAPLAESIGAMCRFDKMGNLIVEVGPPSEPSVLFVGYAMTHPAGKMKDPFTPNVIDTVRGRAVRGRGVAEQKTALAALFGALAQAIKRGNLKGRLSVVVLSAGETGRHDAIESAIAALECKPQFAIVCIGTDGKIALGNKGRVDFDVLVHGKTSHSSVPSHGINAIAGARRILSVLEELKLDVAEHPHFGAATLTPTAIESAPKATHTVPDLVRVTYDRRLLPGEDPHAAYDAIRRTIMLPSPWTVECRLGPIMYPNELAPDSALVRMLHRAFEMAGQLGCEHIYCNFALDAGHFASLGTEAVMLGPGEIDQFHSSEESVLIATLTSMAKVYYSAIEQCLA
jgi:acetylornithine deacetylase